MTVTVSNGVDVWFPTTVDGFESEREGRTIVHPILGTSNVDITERPAALRTGTLRMVFRDTVVLGGYVLDEDGYVIFEDSYTTTGETYSKSCEDAHAAGSVFTFVASERDTIGMSYVVPRGGRIRRYLESTTRRTWVLEVDFQEVSA